MDINSENAMNRLLVGDQSCQTTLKERTRKDERTQNTSLWELRYAVWSCCSTDHPRIL